MARNGSGTYNLPPSNPVVSGTVIESDWANETMADIAAALSQSLAYDGQTVPIANLPMGGFRHTNVSEATSRNQYATLGTVQDGKHTRVQIVSGVDNLVGTLVGGATAYTAGSLVTFFAPAQNTGPMTLNYNGIGARSLVAANGLPLVAGNIKANDFLMAIYDGAQFKLMTAISSTVATQLFTILTTGEERPAGGAYPALTIATGTSVNVPAGTAWIVPPNAASPADATKVSWNAQTITLTNLANSFTTTIAVNSAGQITQFAGRILAANLRNYAILGVVEHITGVANSVTTKPTIFSDDNYRTTDMAALLTNSIISGGLVVADTVSTLRLNISAGSIFMPGGTANTIAAPNAYAIPQQSAIGFRTMAGQNTMGGSVIQDAPVGNYDPNGGGVVTVLPNPGDTVIHRLYFLYGSYIWVYGQTIFTSVENALSMIEYERTKYKRSPFLMDATLIAEIVAQKSTTNLGNIATAAIVSPGAINFSIGSPGGISEAPIDGTPYGRQNAAWTQVLRATSPTVTNDMDINGPQPLLRQSIIPAAAGTAGIRQKFGSFNWFSIDTVWPDDKTYFRSYNTTNNALRFTTTYDLATGVWSMPTGLGVGQDLSVGRNVGIAGNLTVTTGPVSIAGNFAVAGPAAAVDNDIARFNGATGQLLKAGLKYQTSPLDLTAGALLAQGAFGLGNGIATISNPALDAITATGFYRIIGTPSNAPTTGNLADGTLMVVRGLDTISQTVWQYQTGRSWTRAGSPPVVGGVGQYTPWVLNLGQHDGYTQFTGIDLNSMTLSGFYNINNNQANRPSASFGHLLVNAIDVNTVTQIYTEAGATAVATYQRMRAGGTWGAWIPLYTDTGQVLPVMNGNYFDSNTLRVRRIGKHVCLSGIIGRPQAPSSADVCLFIPAGFIPQSRVGWTGLWAYQNLASQMVGCSVNPANGNLEIGFVITVGGAPSGQGQMEFSANWFIA